MQFKGLKFTCTKVFYGFCLKRRGVGVRGAEAPYYYYNAYIRIIIIMLLEVEDALGTLVEQQVEDAEVR